MLALDDEDEMALERLTARATASDVRAALASIAGKHGQDWAEWPSWTMSGLGARTLWIWAATTADAARLPTLVEMAFADSPAADPRAARRLFAGFADALRQLAATKTGAADVAGEAHLDRQAVGSIVEMLLAVGREKASFAQAALGMATIDRHAPWLDSAWLQAAALLERGPIADRAREPDAASESPERTGWRKTTL